MMMDDTSYEKMMEEWREINSAAEDRRITCQFAQMRLSMRKQLKEETIEELHRLDTSRKIMIRGI